MSGIKWTGSIPFLVIIKNNIIIHNHKKLPYMSSNQNVYFTNPSVINQIQGQVGTTPNQVTTGQVNLSGWSILQQPNGLNFTYNNSPVAVIPNPAFGGIPSISFYLNGNLVTVQNPNPTMTLLTYIRNFTAYYGTKGACLQGGCGACYVMQSYYDADSGINRNIAINSCLCRLIDVDGMVITTVEGIKYSNPSFLANGNPYHPVQERLWKTAGFQCGFCTSGMVMATYSALQPNTFMMGLSTGTVAGIDSKTLIEKTYDGNLCRCSAFHGIIKSARSFNPYWQYTGGAGGAIAGYQLTTVGSDGTGPTGSAYYVAASSASWQQFLPPGGVVANSPITGQVTSVSGNSLGTIFGSFQAYSPANDVNGNSTGAYYGKNINYYSWLQSYTQRAQLFSTTSYGYNASNPSLGYTTNVYRVLTVSDALSAILNLGYNNVKLQNSWTSNVVPGYAFNAAAYQNYLDTSRISTLQTTVMTSTGATFGANTPINKVVQMLYTSSDNKWKKMADHLFYVSGHGVRNQAAIVGSLAMSKQGFNGDVTPVLLAGKATLSGYYINASASIPFSGLSIDSYLAASTSSQMIFITSVTVPASAAGEFYWSYRVAQRPYNSHAFLNIGFNTTLSGATNQMSNTIVCYGALGNTTGVTVARATSVETYLNSQALGSAPSTAALNTIITQALTNAQSAITVTPLVEFSTSAVANYNTVGRQQLVSSLLFASLLQLINVPFPLATNWPKTASALVDWVHKTEQGLSDNTYEYIFNPIGTNALTLTGDDAATYPVHQSFPRLDGLYVTSGEARYIDDTPHQAVEYFLASVGSTVAVGVVDWYSGAGIAARNAAKNYALSVPGVVDYFDWYDLQASVANGGMALTNQLSVNMGQQELLGNQCINYLGHRIAVVVATSPELAKRVASIIEAAYPYQYLSAAQMSGSYTTGNKLYFTNPAINIYDAVSKATVNPGYMTYGGTGALTGCNSYLGKNAQNRLRNNQVPRYFPYSFQTGDYGYEANYTTPIVGVPPNGFTGPYVNPYPSWTGPDSKLYYTGADGNAHLYSPYIISNPTGVFLSDVNHLYLERVGASCYRDDEGNYVVYHATQLSADCWNSFFASLVSGTSNPIINKAFIQPNQLIFRQRRIGGSYGGKLYQHSYPYLAIIACIRNNGVMCRYVPTIQEDFQHNGARADTWLPYNVGFDATGALQSVYMKYNYTHNAGANQAVAQVLGRNGVRNQSDALTCWNTLFNSVPNTQFDLDAGWVPRPMSISYRSAHHGEGHVGYTNLLDDIAAILGKSFTDVSQINTPIVAPREISIGISPTIFQDMFTTLTTDPNYNYAARYDAIYNPVSGFNALNTYKKRALIVGYSMYDNNKTVANQHDVMIRVAPNGDVMVWACYPEGGQGSWVKMAQVISAQLGVPIANIFQMEYDRRMNWGDNDTGGSQGTYDACLACVDACSQLKAMITGALGNCFSGGASAFTGTGNSDLLFTVPSGNWNNGFIANNTTPTPNTLWGGLGPMTGAGYTYNLTDLSRKNNANGWRTLVNCMNSIGVFYSGCYGNYAGSGQQGGTPAFQGVGKGASTNVNRMVASGNEAYYQLGVTQVYQCTCVEVEVDALTGNIFPREVDIIVEVGNDVNPFMDAEQMLGGYVYALGIIMTEMRTYDASGKQLINDTWNYKVPCMTQLPNVMKYQTADRRFIGVATPDPQFTLPYGSRSVAEHGCCAGATTLAAVKSAIREFRKQNKLNPLFNVMLPLTPDEVIAQSGYGANAYSLSA